MHGGSLKKGVQVVEEVIGLLEALELLRVDKGIASSLSEGQ